jgi:hypothetical protein
MKDCIPIQKGKDLIPDRNCQINMKCADEFKKCSSKKFTHLAVNQQHTLFVKHKAKVQTILIVRMPLACSYIDNKAC